MTPLPAPSPMNRPLPPFTIRETPDGLFQVLCGGIPVDIGPSIECPYEAAAFLRAANGVSHGDAG